MKEVLLEVLVFVRKLLTYIKNIFDFNPETEVLDYQNYVLHEMFLSLQILFSWNPAVNWEALFVLYVGDPVFEP